MTNTKLKPNYFFPLFVLLVVADLIIGASNLETYRQLTKPLILLSLLIYFGINGKILPRQVYYLMLTALFFSLLGDVMLLYENKSGMFFMLGLISFLIAHLIYCVVFLKKYHKKLSSSFWLVLLLLIGYGGTLFLFLKDSLGQLKIPVVFYILGILAMAVSAYGRKGRTNTTSFKLVFLGALCFVASDSILAINKFMIEIPLSSILIMGTYALAQYCITKGILIENET